ncbi:MAG TPA: hypothetical protein VF712_13035 [Thermoleophilaceae bacterium]|jgi:hypothetical protein
MRRGLLLLAIGAALLGAGCGDDDEDEKKDGAGAPAATSGSSIECLSLSTLSPEVHGSPEHADKTIQPLMTAGAKAATILTGRLGADVIEYPDAKAAEAGLQKARASKALTKEADPSQMKVIEKTLFVDYTREPHVRRVVEACAAKPGEPPPT